LNDHLRITQENKDEEAITKIGVIIHHEPQCSFWRTLNYSMGKKKMCSAISIQAQGDGGIFLECSAQDVVGQTIFSKVHNKQYTMTGGVPICKGELIKDFGYTANTPALRVVLEGTYIAPLDSNSATCDLLAEIATIHCLIPKKLVSITITPLQWRQYWKIFNKKTLSSELGIHFGHYIVDCKL
jgi:hypothetical protein